MALILRKERSEFDRNVGKFAAYILLMKKYRSFGIYTKGQESRERIGPRSRQVFRDLRQCESMPTHN